MLATLVCYGERLGSLWNGLRLRRVPFRLGATLRRNCQECAPYHRPVIRYGE
jgi:hypothetical protein